MSKSKKDKKPRPDKYAEKVAINVSFEDAMQIFADAANDKVNDKVHEPNSEEPNVL